MCVYSLLNEVFRLETVRHAMCSFSILDSLMVIIVASKCQHRLSLLCRTNGSLVQFVLYSLFKMVVGCTKLDAVFFRMVLRLTRLMLLLWHL